MAVDFKSVHILVLIASFQIATSAGVTQLSEHSPSTPDVDIPGVVRKHVTHMMFPLAEGDGSARVVQRQELVRRQVDSAVTVESDGTLRTETAPDDSENVELEDSAKVESVPNSVVDRDAEAEASDMAADGSIAGQGELTETDDDDLVRALADESVGYGDESDTSSSRRRSVHEAGACNSGAEIGGSENFASCNWPNMISGGRRRWVRGHCKCKSGYQQGPDGYNGEGKNIIWLNGICVPCGCVQFFDQNAISLNLCPVTYPSKWINGFVKFSDTMVLPAYTAVVTGMKRLKEQIVVKVGSLKTWMNENVARTKLLIKAHVNTSLMEMREVHAAALIGMDFDLETDGVWLSIKETWNALQASVSTARAALMDQAKAAWKAARALAARLKAAASAVAAALTDKLTGLLNLVKAQVALLAQPFKEKLAAIGTFMLAQYKKLKDTVSGAFSMENFNLQLLLVNPLPFKGTLTKLVADVDYQPDLARAGGRHGVTTRFDVGRVEANLSTPILAYGATKIDLWTLIKHYSGALSFNISTLLNHGIMGFLEDAATGEIKLSLKVENLDFKLFGTEVGWITDFVHKFFAIFGAKRVELPLELPADYKAKAKDACDAYNYLLDPEQNVTTMKASEDKKLNKKLNTKCNVVKQCGDDQALLLQKEVEDKEAESVKSAEALAKCDTELTKAMVDGDKEVTETKKQAALATKIAAAQLALEHAAAKKVQEAKAALTVAVNVAMAQVDKMKTDVTETVKGWIDGLR